MTLRGQDSYITWCFHIYGWPKRTSQTSSGETSHNTSSLKGWITYDSWHCWLTRKSHPCRSHPMLYGCGCGVVENPNCLMTSTEMRFFCLPLSTIKCNRVPFTHICEWKRCSPSSGFVGSSGWIVAIATIVVASTSMIYPLPVFLESNSESRFKSLSLISTIDDYF